MLGEMPLLSGTPDTSVHLPQNDILFVPKEISLEELAQLQQEIELLEGKTMFAQGRKNETARKQSLVDIETLLQKNPDSIAFGLSHEETFVSTITLIETALDLGRGEEAGKVSYHRDRAMTDQEKFALSLEGKVLESQGVLEEILKGKDQDAKKLVLDMMSSLLNSSSDTNRAESEEFLKEHIRTLQELFFESERISSSDEIMHTWKNIFLHTRDPRMARFFFGSFDAVWEARQKNEFQKREEKKQKGEEYTEREWSDVFDVLWEKIFLTDGYAFDFQKNLTLENAIDMTGLDGRKMMSQWMRVKDSNVREGVDENQSACMQNLKALYEVKQSSPEAPKVLFEQFGITHFARYTRETLLKQYEERQEQKPYGVALFALSDHNGALFNMAMILDTLQNDLAKNGYLLRIVEADSKASVARRFVNLDRSYGQSGGGHKIDFALIAGHGSKESIAFGEGTQERDRFLTKEMEGKGIHRGVETFFTPEAKAVLFSCQTGSAGGIGEEIFQKLGLSVQAPEESSYVAGMTVSFTKENKPVFDVQYKQANGDAVSTMGYQKNDVSV